MMKVNFDFNDAVIEKEIPYLPNSGDNISIYSADLGVWYEGIVYKIWHVFDKHGLEITINLTEVSIR